MKILASAISFLVIAACLRGAVPKSPYYPFAPADLEKIRAISRAESIPDAPDLTLAWELYGKVQGSWKPGAPKPSKEVILQLDELKSKLESAPKPQWFQDALNSSSAPSGQVTLPKRIGDDVFFDEADSPAYQSQKALTIVYLAEHEIDRPDAVDKAGRYLTLLSVKHPWDWEVHALYARLLSDAELPDPSFHAAVMSIYLNPSPAIGDLEFFAFIGACSKKDQWDEIRRIIDETAPDERTAKQVSEKAKRMFKSKTCCPG